VAEDNHTVRHDDKQQQVVEEENEPVGVVVVMESSPPKDKSVRWNEPLIQVHEIPVEGKGISVLEFRKQLDTTKSRVKRSGELKDLKEYFSEAKKEENQDHRHSSRKHSADDVTMMMMMNTSSSFSPPSSIKSSIREDEEEDQLLAQSLDSGVIPPLSKRYRKSGSSPRESRPMLGFHPRDEISTLEYSFKLVTIEPSPKPIVSNPTMIAPTVTTTNSSVTEAEKKETTSLVEANSASVSDNAGTLSASADFTERLSNKSKRRKPRRKNPALHDTGDNNNSNEEEIMRAQMLSRMPAFLRGYGTIR